MATINPRKWLTQRKAKRERTRMLSKPPLLILSANSSLFVAGETSTHEHPILRMAKQMPGFGKEHVTQLAMLHALRELLPVLNRAMKGRRQLEGVITVESDDEGLKAELNDFVEAVAVGFIEEGATKGLNSYLDAVATAADEYGLGVGELQMDARGREIRRLVVPNMRSFSLKKGKGIEDEYELHQQQRGGSKKVEGPHIHRISYGVDNGGVWPMPMAWGLPFVGEIFFRMFSALANLWWKSGDPSSLYAVAYDKEVQAYNEIEAELPDGTIVKVDRTLRDLRESVEGALMVKNAGLTTDGYISVVGGKIEQLPLGADPSKSLAQYLEAHYPIIEGQVIGVSDLPSWMFTSGQSRSEGIGSNRANVEAALAIAAAKQRQRIKREIARDVIDTFLLSQGSANAVGNYSVAFEATSVLDEKLEQECRKTEAEADAQIIENSFQLYNVEDESAEGQDVRINEEQRRYLEEKGVLMPEN